MCCEMCKIGIAVGSTKAICRPTRLFHEQYGEVYQSCCNLAISKYHLATRMKSISRETKKNYLTATGQLYFFIQLTLF